MNGKTYPYLELAALPAVGAALLDPRPAFVFRGDGTGLLWANAAGAGFFGDGVGAALHRRHPLTGRFARQIARLARLLPSDHARLEILRFNLGVRLNALPASCRRLNLADGATAVLAIGQVPVPRESLSTRAERLADAIASKECLVAVLTADGRVLGASGRFDDLAPASAAIDAMIDGVAAAATGLLMQEIEIAAAKRPAGIVRFVEAGQPLFLLIVGPAEAGGQPTEDLVANEGIAADREPALRPHAEEPPPPPASEADHRQTGVSPSEPVDGPVATGARTESPQPAEAVPERGAVPVASEPILPDSVTASLEPDPVQLAEPSAAVPLAIEAGLASSSAVEIATGAPSEPAATSRPRSTVFLWQSDREQRFVFVSPELAALVGSAAAAVVGRSWSEVAERFALDPEGRVAARFAGETGWAGEAVDWPVADGRTRIAVEISAIPLLDREHRFAGFRGFGMSEPDRQGVGPLIAPFETEPKGEPVPVTEPAAVPAAGHAAATEPTPAPELGPPLAGPEAISMNARPVTGAGAALRLVGEEDIDVAARNSIEQGAGPAGRPDAPAASEAEPPVGAPASAAGEPTPGQSAIAAAAPSLPPSPTESAARRPPEAEAQTASNVVRLPGTPVRALPAERLTGTEQDAFRRIADTLGVKMPEGMRTPEERRRGETTARPAVDSEAEPSDTRLLDKLPVGIVIYRERGILFVNRTLLDYLGYDTPEDFARAGGAEAIFPDRGRAETVFPDAHGILTARRRDGVDLRVEARLHAVPWGAATALMLSLVKHDAPPEPVRNDDGLTEHLVAAERRIDELATILDTATDGIVVVDEHGRIENINKSAEALFGIEASVVLRQPFTELFAEESRKAALDYLDGLASNGVASVLNDGREVIGKVPKGGLIPLFMTMGRLGGGPKFCAVLRDITHWKNVEEELIAAKHAAETANAQKSEFLAKISHEIRTPLNAIIGFSEVMMGERFGPIGNERYRDYLRDIHVSGEHLMSLINDLLDLSKIEAGKLELAFEAVAVNETIQECVALMQPQANRERIIIRTSLSAGVPNVVADQRSLRQILLNLLSNAIKFTSAGGQVIVATTLEESGEVVLRIRDTGIGMSEKDLETAMKPFRQVTTTAARRGEGTGLGLPLTKALVEANRASFSIDSAPNQGTLVKITFPTTRVLAG